MTSVIGVMEGAFFVSKRELLDWINSLLGLQYTKVEQACTGAAYCQILDALYPGKVPLSKVNFKATHDFEYVANFKIVQSVFAKCGIDKIIEVDRIVKGKPLDNLEFMQWMKRFFDLHYNGAPYDGPERRRQVGIKSSDVLFGVDHAQPYSAQRNVSEQSAQRAQNQPPASKSRALPVKTPIQKTTKVLPRKPSDAATAAIKEKKAPAHQTPQRQPAKEATDELEYLRYTASGLEKERDYYFGKLREVELLCQGYQADPSTMPSSGDVVKRIFDILYEKDPQQQ